MNRTNKTILSFALLLTILITNASEELLRQLAREVDPNQAQKKTRMFLQGDQEKCIELFQQALKENNAVAQLYLSNTHTTMGWSKDHEKDFSKGIKEEQLESYNIAPNAMKLLEWMHEEADPRLHKDWKKMEKAAHRTVDQAEETGNLYAKLLKILESNPHNLFWNFQMACKLKPLIDQAQFPELLSSFGNFLFYSGIENLQFKLEGIKYKEKSGFLNIEFFEDTKNKPFSEKNFQDYCGGYVKHKELSTQYTGHGIQFVGGNTILAPSREHWEKFKKETLETVQSSPAQLFDLFEKHDMNKIYNLIQKYKLSLLYCSFYCCSTKRNLPCLNIYYEESEKVKTFAEIKLTDTESKNTIVNIQLSSQEKIIEEIGPVISFLRDAVSRCG